jgi:hypothetical protein
VAVVADDDVHIADLIAVVLEPLGLEVVKVHNGPWAPASAMFLHCAEVLVFRAFGDASGSGDGRGPTDRWNEPADR